MKFISLSKLAEESVSHNPEIRKKVMLRAGELPHLTNFSQANFAPGQTSPAHAHQDMWEVFFVESGSGVISINAQEYPLFPGDCAVVEPGEVHEIRNNSDLELVLTYFGLKTSQLS